MSKPLTMVQAAWLVVNVDMPRDCRDALQAIADGAHGVYDKATHVAVPIIPTSEIMSALRRRTKTSDLDLRISWDLALAASQGSTEGGGK